MTDPDNDVTPNSRKIVKEFLSKRNKGQIDPESLVDALLDLATTGKKRDYKLIDSTVGARVLNSQRRVVNKIAHELSADLLTQLMDKLLPSLLQVKYNKTSPILYTAAASELMSYVSPSVLRETIRTLVTMKEDTKNTISALFRYGAAKRLHQAGEVHALFNDLAQIDTPNSHYAIMSPFSRDRPDLGWGFTIDCGIVGKHGMKAYFLRVDPRQSDRGQIVLIKIDDQIYSGSDPIRDAERHYAGKGAILPGPKKELEHVRRSIDRLKEQQLGTEVGEGITGSAGDVNVHPPNVPGGYGTTLPTQPTQEVWPPPRDSGWDRGGIP